MTYAVEVESLKFSYNEKKILNNVTFSVEKGEFVSIIGPNGSGKSTLLKNIASNLKPDKGCIKIDGRDLKLFKSKELAKKMALVPQDTNISFDFQVFDIVLMGRSPYLSRFEREKEYDYEVTTQALKLTDTFYLRDRNINEISGGERQRVIIARALAQEPEIILLDEPTSHLDINHQIEILNLLHKLNREKGMTILIVIHDINLAARYSNKMMLLNDGEILSIGKPEDVVTQRNMEKAYNMDIIVNENPYTNSPYIIPISHRKKNNKVSRKKIHIICGGGTGEEVIRKLELNGYKISLGVVNIGDSDWKLGKRLSLKMIEEMPFTDISQDNFERNINVIKESDIIVLTSIPYGRGNIKNIEAAYRGLQLGKNVILIDDYGKYDTFDYIEGKAQALLDKMKSNGLKIVKTVDRLLEII